MSQANLSSSTTPKASTAAMSCIREQLESQGLSEQAGNELLRSCNP